MKEVYIHVVREIGKLFEEVNIPYEFISRAALSIQQVPLNDYSDMEVLVQWDLFNDAMEVLSSFSPSTPVKTVERAATQFIKDGILVKVGCVFNTTIKTDPYRISQVIDGQELWCRSLYSYLYDKEMEVYQDEIHSYLASEQQAFTAQNEDAWNQNNYIALVNRYGQPKDLAEKISYNPKWRLHPFYKYLDDVKGKNITHLMGSNGVKAVALAILEAEVKVIDFSRENAAFANELAAASNVDITYIVSDILSLGEDHMTGDQDFVLMELGVLHYLIDLHPLLQVVKRMLKPGGRFVLHEFHPISTKLITSNGKKHKVTGNYFAPIIERNPVAFTKHMPDEEKEQLSQVIQRKWTIGELITAVGQSGLVIKVFEEEPNHKLHDIGLPKTYTLVAERV